MVPPIMAPTFEMMVAFEASEAENPFVVSKYTGYRS
jgi:hypothetical protein